jgi:hypothetical protein
MGEMSSWSFLEEIGKKVWPQTWGMFASFKQDPLRVKLVEKLKAHGVISQEAPINEELPKEPSKEFVDFMIQAREQLYMPTILDLTTLLLEGYNDPIESPNEFPVVVLITKDRLRNAAANLDREVTYEATGFEGRVVDLLLDLVCEAIWQVIIDNGCEVAIEHAPVTFRVPS